MKIMGNERISKIKMSNVFFIFNISEFWDNFIIVYYDKLCTMIKNSLPWLIFLFRYKIVCIVQIVEKRNQGVLSILRFLRDLEKDKYVESYFENIYLYASVAVGAMYYE